MDKQKQLGHSTSPVASLATEHPKPVAPSEIYRGAAMRIAAGRNRFSCCAIEDEEGYPEYGDWSQAVKAYRKTFGDGRGMLFISSFEELPRPREARILALLLMSEIAKDEERNQR